MAEEESLAAQELLGWNFPEFRDTPRSNRWYLWFGVIAALFAVYGMFTDNFLFAVIILLFSLILFLQNWRKPGMIHFGIFATGLQIGRNFYEYRDLREFWIVYKPEVVDAVYFDFSARWRPIMGIPLAGANPLQVREILLEYLPENLEKEEEPTTDAVARWLKL